MKETNEPAVSSRRTFAGVLYPAILLVGFFVFWQWWTKAFQVPPYFVPSPGLIFATMRESPGLLLHHTWVTLQEVLAGFALAFGVGFALAILISFSSILRRVIYPFVIASQTIPVIAIAPLLVVWFGYGILPKVIMTALIAFFPIVVNSVDGINSVDEELVNLMRSQKATNWQIFSKVQLPSALPFIFAGTKIAIAVSVIGAVVGEWVGADVGLGFLMIRANAQLRTDIIFAALFILAALGIGLFLLVAVAEHIAFPWRRVQRGN